MFHYIAAAAPAWHKLREIPGAATHVTEALAAAALQTLRSIPDHEWLCRSRKNARPRDQDTSDQVTLGLCPTQNYYNGIPMPTVSTPRYPNLCALLLQYLRIAMRISVRTQSVCSHTHTTFGHRHTHTHAHLFRGRFGTGSTMGSRSMRRNEPAGAAITCIKRATAIVLQRGPGLRKKDRGDPGAKLNEIFQSLET